jgi:hypothetical protein
MLQRERVVAPQVLDIGHDQAVLLEERLHLGERRDVGAGEDVALDPWIRAPRTRVADEVQQTAPFRLEPAIDQLAELRVVAPAHVLEHADGDERVEAALRAAVVVLDELHPTAEPTAQRRCAREADLLGRHVEGLHRDAVVLGHVERERAPAAAGLEHALARPQPQLAADVVELRLLRLLEREPRVLEVCARVDEVRVEPALVELVAEVVVVVDIGARARGRVAAPARAERIDQVARDAGRVLRRAEHDLDRVREIALDLEPSVRVRLAEAEARIAQQAPEHAPIAHVHARDRALLRADLRAVPQHEGDRGSPDCVEQPAQGEV